MEKPVVFKNENNKQLVGVLHLPEGKGKWPLVIICHGFDGLKSKRKFVRLARALAKNKIASLRFDFEGHGDSEGEFETITIKKQVSDLEAVIKRIKREKRIDEKKISFLGHSLGCVTISLFIAKNKFPVEELVFWSPAFNQKELIPYWYTKSDLRRWKKDKFFIHGEIKINIGYLRENRDRNYSFVLEKIQVPILTIHGKKDDIVPLKFSKNLAKDHKNIQLKIYPKGDHEFEDYFVQKKLIKDTVKWFKKCLKEK